MAPKKKVLAMVTLQIKAGNATPAPPVGTALGQHGVNIMEFCKTFNARTQGQEGMIIPVVITVYADRSFTLITKTPPAAILLKKTAQIAKGSSEPNRNKVAKLSKRSYPQMRVTVLEFLDTTVFDLSNENCIAFLDPLIESWDIDLATFCIEIVLNRRVAPGHAAFARTCARCLRAHA